MYLLNPLKAKSAAHYWDGKDTLCRMYSTGGLSKLKQQIFNDPMGKPICSMCVNVQRKTSMQAKPKVEMCANRFELVTQLGQPVDKAWAMGMFKTWPLVAELVKREFVDSTRRCWCLQTKWRPLFRTSAPGRRPLSQRIWKPLQMPRTVPPAAAKFFTDCMIGENLAIAPQRR